MRQQRLADFADWLNGLGPLEIKLSAYRKDGMCWHKVGEFKVTDAMRKDLDLAETGILRIAAQHH
jgi:hypothetical protein